MERNTVAIDAQDAHHFLGLASLGLVHLQLGQKRAALTAFEKALAINPHLTGVRCRVERLKVKIEDGKT